MLQFAGLLCVALLSGFADVPTVAPEKAAEYKDKEVSIDMTVKSGRLSKNFCFLNSEEDHKSAKNFTVILKEKGISAFKAAKIEDVSKHFNGKKIRVVGKVTIHKDKPQIEVEKVDQIKIIEEGDALKDVPTTDAKEDEVIESDEKEAPSKASKKEYRRRGN
jgi:DNA/RNA endonuclease YhcR with UshA esterase domain